MKSNQNKTGAAFHELIETLKAAEAVFLKPEKNMSGQGIVQGYRHLAHLLSYGFDCYLESDPERPEFFPLASPTKKMLGDNVDSIYHFTQIRGDRSYRISGKRGNDCYLSFCVYGGKPDGEWSEHICANINHRSMVFDKNGNFEIMLTPDPRSAGEFQIHPDSVCIISRQYFFDMAGAVPADFNIEPLEPAGAPAHLSDDECARRLRSVATFIKECCQVVPLPGNFSGNTLGDPFGFTMTSRSWGTPDNIYSIGSFRLEPGECLVIHGRSPECAYWGVQTWNHYMQSFDYRYHRVSLNKSQIALGPDGSFTVIVSAEDPGVPNWVGTGAHREGIMFCRWLLADKTPEKPECSVKRISALSGL